MQTPQTPSNSSEVFAFAKEYALLSNLKQQLEKDFKLSGIDLTLDSDAPEDIVQRIEAKTVEALQAPNSIQNLLYTVDVPEAIVASLPTNNPKALSKAIAFLILKRCWMKVWYKAKY